MAEIANRGGASDSSFHDPSPGVPDRGYRDDKIDPVTFLVVIFFDQARSRMCKQPRQEICDNVLRGFPQFPQDLFCLLAIARRMR